MRLPATALLFAAGLGTGLLPGPAPVRVDPELVIWLFLPPVIYAGTVRVTPHLLRIALLPGVLVGVVTSLCIVVGVAMVLRTLLLPGLGWTAALTLGVVAALFDTRLFHEADGRPHVPRALGDALKAREMAARVTALVSLKLTLDALAAGQASGLGEAALDIAWSVGGGAVAGAVIARAVLWLRDRAGPAPVEIAVSLATPYLAALAARGLGLSLAVAVIAAALTVAAARVNRQTGEARSSAEARITAAAFWEELSLIASSVLFFLAGLALPDAWASLGDWPGWRTAGAAGGHPGHRLGAAGLGLAGVDPLAAAARGFGRHWVNVASSRGHGLGLDAVRARLGGGAVHTGCRAGWRTLRRTWTGGGGRFVGHPRIGGRAGPHPTCRGAPSEPGRSEGSATRGKRGTGLGDRRTPGDAGRGRASR
jgi:hypothetical protein